MPVTPGTTSAYLVLRNNSTRPDSLVAVRTSAGGRVEFRMPARGGTQMRSVPAIVLPPHTTVRLFLTDRTCWWPASGTCRTERLITLTLEFRHASPVQVQAIVTNPSQTGGTSNYFMN